MALSTMALNTVAFVGSATSTRVSVSDAPTTYSVAPSLDAANALAPAWDLPDTQGFGTQ